MHTLQYRVNTYAKANNEIRERRKITITLDTVNDAKQLFQMYNASASIAGIKERISVYMYCVALCMCVFGCAYWRLHDE